MRYYINCTFNEKEEVQKLGALWDWKEKKWYFSDASMAKKFEKWLPANFKIITKKEDPALTNLCKDLDLNRGNVQKWLIANGYLIDIYTVTELGKENGIYESTTPSGKIKVVYNKKAQQLIKDNIKEIEGVILDTYIKPELVPIEFTKLGFDTTELIIDTETTGVENDDEVVELAILDFTGEELYHSMFMPEKDMHWAAAKKTGITKKKLTGNPLFKDEWEKIKSIIGNRKLVGHNIEFDYKLVKQTLNRYGLDETDADNIFEGRIDSMKLAKRYITAPNYKLATICELLKIEDDQKHRATYDCLLLLKMLRGLEETDLVKKKSFGGINSSNEKKEKLKLVIQYVEAGYDIAMIAKSLMVSSESVERYILELLNDGLIDYNNFANPKSEKDILAAISTISNWDKKLKPIKELLDDSISYFDIKVVLQKNNLI